VLAAELFGLSAVIPYGFMLFRYTAPSGSRGLPLDDGRVVLPPEKRFNVHILVPCYKVGGREEGPGGSLPLFGLDTFGWRALLRGWRKTGARPFCHIAWFSRSFTHPPDAKPPLADANPPNALQPSNHPPK
jgi:hypothetical protein